MNVINYIPRLWVDPSFPGYQAIAFNYRASKETIEKNPYTRVAYEPLYNFASGKIHRQSVFHLRLLRYTEIFLDPVYRNHITPMGTSKDLLDYYLLNTETNQKLWSHSHFQSSCIQRSARLKSNVSQAVSMLVIRPAYRNRDNLARCYQRGRRTNKNQFRSLRRNRRDFVSIVQKLVETFTNYEVMSRNKIATSTEEIGIHGNNKICIKIPM